LAVLATDLAIESADERMIRDDRKRCIAVLLRLGNFRRSMPTSFNAGDIKIAQADLAFLSNLSRNAVGKILRELEENGMIALSYRNITVLKPIELREMSAD